VNAIVIVNYNVFKPKEQKKFSTSCEVVLQIEDIVSHSGVKSHNWTILKNLNNCHAFF